jgi:PAS domain S-box-containing protein
LNAFSHVQRFTELIEEDNSPIYVGYSHPNGKFIYVNSIFARDMGYTKDEIYEKNWVEFLSQKDKDRVMTDYIDKVSDNSTFSDYETTYLTKDGKEIKISWYTSSPHTGTDKLTLCIGIPMKSTNL